MDKFPFQLKIKRRESDGQIESLTCSGLLRDMPGRREVYDAVWNGRAVIVKIFSAPISAKRHIRREWKGLKGLRDRGFNSPEPLFYGQTKDNRWAVVLEKITDSITALEVFERTAEKTGRAELLSKVCGALARQHKQGIMQKDLHLGNILLKDDELFLFDVGQMRFFAGPIPRKRSIHQLAILLSQYCSRDAELVPSLSGSYFSARGWSLGQSDKALLKKYMDSHSAKGLKRGLKKSLRTTSRYLRVDGRGYTGVFEKSFCDKAGAVELMEKIDELMDAGEILKKGNTSYVSRLEFDGKDVVVKRYNHKGLIHSLRHTIKTSRARRCWLHGQRFGILRLPTPKPLAFIERRKGPIVWESYIVTEYVDAPKLYYYLRDSGVNEEQKQATLKKVSELVDRLAQHRISHGDLKHSNILISPQGPVLTDLDAVKVFRCGWLFNIRRSKDRKRCVTDTAAKDIV